MSYKLNDKALVRSMEELCAVPEGKVLINTINQHSYNVAQTDVLFAAALRNGDYLIPDGMSIVKAARWLNCSCVPKERIAGRDLFRFEMERLQKKTASSVSQQKSNSVSENHTDAEKNCSVCKRARVFFMGSSEKVLALIKERAAIEYPDLEIITYSPPYKPVFSDDDNRKMIDAINAANPDLLWIGMTAPKQEKWAYEHWDELNIHCHCGTIGAVFDFFACPQKDVPVWWQKHGLEWFYRLKSEPKRMFRRYVIGIPKFFYYIMREKINC